LEIRLFLVDFKQEDPDNKQTSGNGLFGSDGSKGLESAALRKADPVAHARRVLRFAQDYWQKASGGRLVIQGRVEVDWKYSLQQEIKFFTLPSRATGENKSEYWNRTEIRLLELVDSAVTRAASDPTGPFALPATNSAKKRTLFACMHAGVNRGTDGGTKGANNADTQRDLLDFFVAPADFRLLAKATDSLRRDSLGVPFKIDGKADTLRSLFLLPEAMSQDGLNWGVGGLLAQQIGSALGLPMTGESGVRDPSPSVLGSWDLMDAGSSAGNGFLPVLPMAWHRLFLGWSTPIEVRPGASRTSTVRLPAVRPGQDMVAVVRLDGGEYLLIENRQRADSAGYSRLRQLVPGVADSLSTVVWRPDSVGYLFEDSLSVGSSRVPNPRKPKGMIASSGVDAGLPGSGLLVWKVNEWLLQEYLSGQAVNPWLGDSLQDHFRGITLLQASGKPTLGQRFKNAAGETLMDYGTGADALPHVRRKIASGKETKRDTVTVIPAVGYVSTQTSSGARTLITLRATWPASSLAERGSIPLDGDSVVNAGDSSLLLEIDWGALRAPQDSLYPVRLPPGVGAYSILPGPSRWPLSSWVVDSTGHVQLLDSTGLSPRKCDTCSLPLFPRNDTILVRANWTDSVKTPFANASTSQSLRRFPVQNLSRLPAGTTRFPIGTATQGDTLCVISRQGLASFVWPEGDSIRTSTHTGRFITAPLGLGGVFYAADTTGMLLRLTPSGQDTVCNVSGPNGISGVQFLARGRTWAPSDAVFAVDSTGRVVRVDLPARNPMLFAAPVSRLPGETFTVSSSDFDRDGADDAFVLGSRGTAALYGGRTGERMPGWPRQFARGPSGQGVAGDPGFPALADLEGSGYPQILFTGTDRLWLVDRNGIAPSGWPVRLGGNDLLNLSTANRRFPAGVVGSSPLVVDLESNGSKQVLLGSPDGRIFAFTASGSSYAGPLLTTDAGAGSKLNYSVSSWPLAAGTRTTDSLLCPWLHPFAVAGRLQSLSSGGGLELFRTGNSKVLWGMPGGDAGRGFWLDARNLGSLKAVADLSGFHFYPHPVRGGKTTVRYDLGKAARSVSLDIFDQTSFVVLHKDGLPTGSGRQSQGLEGLALGTGVYAARLTVELDSGTRTSWFRLAVVR
jgi:hypothetical protein